VNISRQEWILGTTLLVLAALAGWASGRFGWAFVIAIAVHAAVQRRERLAFFRWAERPLRRPENRLESWESKVSRVFRTIRRERGRHRTALRQLRAIRTIAHALPDAVVVIDRYGDIEMFNDAARDILQLHRRDRGANLSSLVRQPDFVALVTGKLADDIVEFASPFADERRLEARRIPLVETRSLILVRDVSQLNRLLSMRQYFIANVSHELRTPLTVIVGYLETLAGEQLDEATTQELIGKLGSPTKRMQALVNDLLLLTRLEASPSPSDEELYPVDMGTLIQAIAVDAQALSDGRHRISVRLDCDLRVLGIESELHSACANLLNNAVRYSPEGGDIEVSWEKIGPAARFSVKDQGLGIPPEHLSRLTERFYRVDLARSRVRGGTGLGLAIVKHVLKRHGSELQVASELGEGSTFYCEFPATRLAGPLVSTQSEPSNLEKS
jgi:two-component system phosphate regulon sensor histidine kinase PhoR